MGSWVGSEMNQWRTHWPDIVQKSLTEALGNGTFGAHVSISLCNVSTNSRRILGMRLVDTFHHRNFHYWFF